MAFGGLKGTLTGNGNNIAASNSIAGSVAVSVGDLVFAVLGQQTNLTATTASDNLGNTYTATNAGVDAGTSSGRAYWARVTVAGTLTSISVAASSSANDWAGSAVVIEGPFAASPLDANPANASDATSPFTCPSTGTLAQAAEVVIAWGAAATGTAWSATSPNTLGLNTANATNIQATIGYQVVSSTGAVTPAFTAGANPTDDTLGVNSFMADTPVHVEQPDDGYAALAAARARSAAFVLAAASAGFVWCPQPITIPAATPSTPLVYDTATPRTQLVYYQNRAAPPAYVAQQAPTTPASGWQTIASVAPPRATVNQSALTAVFPPTSVPSGWQSIASAAPVRAVVNNGSGLTFVVPPFTVPTPSQFGWQSGLSGAPGQAYPVPTQATAFATPAPTTPSWGWLQSFSSAPVAAKAPTSQVIAALAPPAAAAAASPVAALNYDAATPRTQTVYYQAQIAPPAYVAQVSADTTPRGWQAALSGAPEVAKATPTDVIWFGPLPGVPQGWQGDLSGAPPVAQAQQGSSFVPFNTAQTNTQFIDKWLQPLSIAAPVAKPQVGASFVPFDTRQQNTVTIDKWQQPISGAPPVAKAQVGWTFVPFDTAQLAQTPSQFGWWQNFAPSAPVAKAQPGISFVPFDTAQITVPTPSQFGWWQSLSVAAPVVKANVGWTFVPLDTRQINTQTIDKWLQPLSKPVPVAQALPGSTFVPFDTVQPVPTPSQFGWWQQLSKAVPSSTAAAPGWSFVPFDTAQLAQTPGQFGWFAPLSKAVPVAQAQAGFNVVPLTATLAPPFGWYQALTPKASVTLVAAPQGWTFVPLDTAQAFTPTPSQFGWWTQLSVSAPVAQPQQGDSSVPFDTVQIAPPVDPGLRGGETVLRPGGPALTRKRWLELLEELRQGDIPAAFKPTQSKKAIAAVSEAKRDVLEAVDHRLVTEETGRELAKLVVAAEGAQKMVTAIERAQLVREELNRIYEEDEEEVLMLLLTQ